ncbi:DNA mismatch repair protein MutS2 [Enterococcus sp. PF1-24]|uniref:endonuclease MutS2 n=1 Tax=unclassified Enterococcus TaxID=2608891 RepID=UPI00247387C3|nr:MULTISPECIES: endonuclease MutS2 [unclassified Enterococcus]MDH6365357.1 DNA mismatch repair protein MutS2 [Enterococcus sp. PFB1-1]MDH6402458.1 DNA mismatch repair protein MutS2 [Enterococcus sp. PF1-24]
MNQQLLEITQYIEIKQRWQQLAISDAAKEIIEQRDPSSSLAAVNRWLDESAEAMLLLDSGQHVPFMGLTRIQQLTTKIEKGMILEPTELLEYGDFLRSFRLISKLFAKNQYQTPLLYRYTNSLVSFTSVEEIINSSVQGNHLADENFRELRKIRGQVRKLEKEIQQKLAKYLKNSGSTSYLQDKMILMKDDRYTLPVRIEFKNKIAGNIIETSNKGTTVYIEPHDVSKLNDQLVLAKSSEVAEVYQILAYLTGLIAEKLMEINFCKETVVELDIIFARGKLSRALAGSKPLVNQEDRLVFKGVKHPLLGNDAVPLSLELGTTARGLIITGPNAGGKTVVLKTIALTCLLTMSGIFVANQPGTEIAIFKEIFLDIGDQQSLPNSLSTFSGHMQHISEILQAAKQQTLVLVDEIGSGTEPKEGAALGIAIMGKLYRKGALIVATTHYGEIKDFALQHEDFVTAAMAFDVATLSPKYQLLMNKVGDSNAFWIAKKMVISEDVLIQAKNFLTDETYPTAKKTFKYQQKSQTTQDVETTPKFQQGDRVLAKDLKQVGLFYEALENNFSSIYIEGTFHKVLNRRLELQARVADLYPADYDLNQLFTSFSERKQQRDLERGSKKAQKKLDKEARARKAQLSKE